MILQDKTGTIDAKIWDPGSVGIDEFDALDYVAVTGDVTSFQGNLQMSIRRVRRASEGEYDPKEYLPCTDKDVEEMYGELTGFMDSVKNPYLNKLLHKFFDNETFVERFKFHSAAKSVHHGFVGGLLEHTLSVTRNCNYCAQNYPFVNRDLLLAASIFHDIGKLKELSAFPANDYTDAGQLLGHIYIGADWLSKRMDRLGGFAVKRKNELLHCILAHHGELEYGSPKKPALAEAVALSMADNLDAKMEAVTELFSGTEETGWLGYQRQFESNMRKTGKSAGWHRKKMIL